MAAEADEVFPELHKRLSELERHVEEHDIAHADAADVPEFEAEFFSLARDLLMHAYELPRGFTYEEALPAIESSGRSAPLRAKGTKVTNLLNSLEYAPDRSYSDVDDHLRQLGELIDLAEHEPRLKRIETRKASGGSKIGSAIARATSLLWFPFKWAYLALRRKGHERRIDRDETYQVDELLDRGEAALKKDRLEDAIKTYQQLTAVYQKLPGSLKAQVHERIVSFHSSIIERYEALKTAKLAPHQQ